MRLRLAFLMKGETCHGVVGGRVKITSRVHNPRQEAVPSDDLKQDGNKLRHNSRVVMKTNRIHESRPEPNTYLFNWA